jgi:4-amino-4-deoxy-L-arabinose transferase-like glycosyltransferase
VDAFSLLRFGVDRNGVSFPVYMTSWGSGQNALPAYLMIPFIALGGLTPFAIRLPALIAGIASLPLAYLIAKRTAGPEFGLAAMFVLAISPWHILSSRWGFEGNLLPFVFCVGYFFLLKTSDNPKWFIPGMLFMALCLYTYGPAYAAVPLSLLGAIPVLIWSRRIDLRILALGLLVLILVGMPIGLFALVNTLKLGSLHVGLMTIPRLPSEPRFAVISALFQQDALQGLLQNLKGLASLLWGQEDGFFFSTVRPYGYFYTYTLPFAIVGLPLLFPVWRSGLSPERKLLLCWLLACLVLGVLESGNIGRLNLIFIPLLFCIAAVLAWMAQHARIGLGIGVCVLLAAFVLFNRDYHGPQYRATADREFGAGLLPAIDFASKQTAGPVCVTTSPNMPYIYVLFSQQMDPNDYLSTIKYIKPHSPLRGVFRLGRYSFGLANCSRDPRTVYVLSREGETVPQSAVAYRTATFTEFVVYSPDSP